MSLKCLKSQQWVNYAWQSARSQDFPDLSLTLEKTAQNGSRVLTVKPESISLEQSLWHFLLMLVIDAVWHRGPRLERNDMWPAQGCSFCSSTRLKCLIKCISGARTSIIFVQNAFLGAFHLRTNTQLREMTHLPERLVSFGYVFGAVMWLNLSTWHYGRKKKHAKLFDVFTL